MNNWSFHEFFMININKNHPNLLSKSIQSNACSKYGSFVFYSMVFFLFRRLTIQKYSFITTYSCVEILNPHSWISCETCWIQNLCHSMNESNLEKKNPGEREKKKWKNKDWTEKQNRTFCWFLFSWVRHECMHYCAV